MTTQSTSEQEELNQNVANQAEQSGEQPVTPSPQAELEKDLARREELCEEAEKVAAAQDWHHGSGDLRRLQDEWNNLRRWHDAREDALRTRFEVARKSYYEARDAQREQAKKAKEKIAEEAERLAQSTQWNSAAQRLQELMDEWKAAGTGGDHEADEELWKRFNGARETFNKRRHEHYVELDAERAKAKETKEHLIEEAREAAVTSADWAGSQWRAASDRMRDLMNQWKEAGVAAREDNDRLWEEFQAARQPFFDAQRAHHNEMDAAHKKAEAAKRELIEQAKALAASNDFGREATERAKQLDRDWKQLGYAGKEVNDQLWEEFSKAKESFWDARRADLDQRHEQWVERTQAAIERRRERITNLQGQADRLQERLSHAYATDHVEEMQDRLDEKKQTIADLKAEVKEMESRIKE